VELCHVYFGLKKLLRGNWAYGLTCGNLVQRLEKLLDYQHEGVKRTREHLVHTVEGQLSALK
jgi:hypothetical protein